jgi:putative flippase GtrA
MKKSFESLIKLYFSNRQLVLYLFFGVCTTAINTIWYWLLYDVLTLNNIVSTIVAWFVAVLFAFVTNKVLVFESRRASVKARIGEALSFLGCRMLTGVLDVVIMAVTVDMLQWNGLFWKLISNIIVTVINYIASKFLIFKEKEKKS